MEGAKDPDEYVIKYGNGRFNLLVQNAISLVEFKAKMLQQKFDINNINDKIKFLKETAKLMNTIDSEIEQELYIEKISKEYNISKEALYAELNKLKGNKIGSKLLEKRYKVVTKEEKQEVPKTLQKREDAIVALLINGDENNLKQIKERITPQDLKIDVNRRIVTTIYENTSENINDLLDLFREDQEAVNKITQIMAEDEENSVDKKTLDNLINVYEKEKLTIIKANIIKELSETKEKVKMQKLEEELNNIIIKLAKYK